MNIYWVCISVVAVAYACKAILVPISIAIFLALALSPITQKLERFGVSTSISCTLTLLLFLFSFTALSMAVATPMSEWAEKLPGAGKQIGEKITELSEPLSDLASLPNSGENVSNEIVNGIFSSLFSTVASSTPTLLLQILSTVILTFFIMRYGDEILRRVVEIQNSFKDKKITVDIYRTIQSEISGYLFLILLVNVCLGIAVTTVFYAVGIDDPILWGVAATLLNFAPYLGPIVLIFILLGVGFVQYGFSIEMLLPSSIYGLINIIEAYFVTPTLLGNRLSLNPLIVFLWIMIWGWLWGASGALIGVPMLVAIKIIIQKAGIAGEWSNIVENSNNISSRSDK